MEKKENNTHKLTPIGTIAIIFCFFLPWINVRCGSQKIELTGMKIAEDDPIILVVLLSAIFTLAIYFLYKKDLFKVKKILVSSLFLGGGFLGFKIVTFIEKYEKRIDIFEPNIGIIGTVLGFIIAIVGAVNIFSEEIQTEPPSQKESISLNPVICPKCGAKNDHAAKFCTSCGIHFSEILTSSLTIFKCPACGTENPDENKFCSNCGVLIR